MATTRNIVIKQYNGEDYDALYPQTTASQVKALSGSADADAQAHIANTVRHVTATDRSMWDAAAILATNAIPASQRGKAGGVAELDANGKVPSAQLPSFVDDVLEYTQLSVFPLTGEAGKIYVAQDTNKTYRWTGSSYAVISETIALGETASTAYRGDRGKTAYEHSQASGNPHGTTPANIGAEPAFAKNAAFNKNFGTASGTVCQGDDARLSNSRPANGGNADTVDNKHASDFASTTLASTSAAGLMSAEDKAKLDTVSSRANARITVGSSSPSGAVSGDFWYEVI